MTTPLVSIMMPCYNSARTLPLALSSLLAQTYENWECILVDDGSTDNPYEIVEHIGDPRIHYIRLGQNMGRGAARQAALDNATGEYLCMLDADDWYFPNKLEKQIAIMAEDSDVVLTSGGMAIATENDKIIGVRGNTLARTAIKKRFSQLSPPPVAFAPSMIKNKIAKDHKFDPSLSRSEDMDFLLGILLHHNFVVSPDVVYVYREPINTSINNILLGNSLSTRVFRKWSKEFPVSARLNIGRTMLKRLVYKIAFKLGYGSYLIKRRSHPPSTVQIESFTKAKNIVYSTARQYFDNIIF